MQERSFMKNVLETLQALYDKAEPGPVCPPAKPQEMMLRMSDGVHLRTVCWFPEGGRPRRKDGIRI